MSFPVRRIADGHAGWIAAAAGAILPLGFAPFSFYGLVPLSLAVLWVLWEDRNARVAARLGFLWGAAAFLTGTADGVVILGCVVAFSLARSLNSLASKDLVGKTISFKGAFTIRTFNLLNIDVKEIRIVPVEIKLGE